MVFSGVVTVALTKTRAGTAYKCDTTPAVALLSHCRISSG